VAGLGLAGRLRAGWTDSVRINTFLTNQANFAYVVWFHGGAARQSGGGNQRFVFTFRGMEGDVGVSSRQFGHFLSVLVRQWA
jgi:hypothetical protein